MSPISSSRCLAGMYARSAALRTISSSPPRVGDGRHRELYAMRSCGATHGATHVCRARARAPARRANSTGIVARIVRERGVVLVVHRAARARAAGASARTLRAVALVVLAGLLAAGCGA